MTWIMSEEVIETLDLASKGPLIPPKNRGDETVLDRLTIQSVLPHRDPFLFVDEVTLLDVGKGVIAGRYNLLRAQDVLDGHFPKRPVWPGVLQVEAIGQVGIILALNRAEIVKPPQVMLTHISGVRFIRPIEPDGEVVILVHVFDDGLFYTAAGQCLQEEHVCSIAATRFLLE